LFTGKKEGIVFVLQIQWGKLIIEWEKEWDFFKENCEEKKEFSNREKKGKQDYFFCARGRNNILLHEGGGEGKIGLKGEKKY